MKLNEGKALPEKGIQRVFIFFSFFFFTVISIYQTYPFGKCLAAPPVISVDLLIG